MTARSLLLALAVLATTTAAHARRGPIEVIDAARWAEIRAGVEPRLADLPDAVLHVHDLYLAGRVAGAFAEGERAPEAVADMLAGELGAHGTITTHAGRISLEAPRDTCWLVVARFDRTTGAEEVSFDPHVSDLAAVQPFRFRLEANGMTRSTSGTHLGFCTTKAVTWRADVTLTFAGSKTSWRWVAVRWSRARFPAFVAARVFVRPSEPCNPDAWASAILTPVPGALVVSRRGQVGWLDSTAAPSWVYAEPLVGEGTINVSLEGRGANVLPQRLDLPAAWDFASCDDMLDPAVPRPSRDARVAKLDRCDEGVGKRYDAAIERAEARRDEARDDRAADVAQREVDRLYQAEEAERERACGALTAAIHADMERALRAVVDHLAERPALPGPDVPAYLVARSRTLRALGYPLE